MKKRADQVKIGDTIQGSKVEHIREYGPMLGEAYGYARNVEIHMAPNKAWMTPPSVMAVRGDILLDVGA
jgi:hypothetical protein